MMTMMMMVMVMVMDMRTYTPTVCTLGTELSRTDVEETRYAFRFGLLRRCLEKPLPCKLSLDPGRVENPRPVRQVKSEDFPGKEHQLRPSWIDFNQRLTKTMRLPPDERDGAKNNLGRPRGCDVVAYPLDGVMAVPECIGRKAVNTTLPGQDTNLSRRRHSISFQPLHLFGPSNSDIPHRGAALHSCGGKGRAEATQNWRHVRSNQMPASL
ncbi:hypothetical protein EYF80_017874 [Liparis tanakae]|uniref:Secreted protein n=1 Tax=Liparis tanakae TaxID=230148 RepID=A0A4Z2I1K4_9TELE|nr:hypothetical protein EYF80_017874 [Liparis tanakae]